MGRMHVPPSVLDSAATYPPSYLQRLQRKMSDNAAWKAAKPYVNGGLSGMMATSVIQPIDMVKVRLQLGEKGSPVSASVAACLNVPSTGCSSYV